MSMKLKELLIKVFERMCVRNDGESDEDYLTRCGNAQFVRQARAFYLTRRKVDIN
jgi:hypothetical protein